MENFNRLYKELQNLRLYNAGETSQQQQPPLISPAMPHASGNTTSKPHEERETSLPIPPATHSLQAIQNHHRQRLRTRLHALLTTVEGEGPAEFKDMIARNDGRELRKFACMLTSNSDHFFEIVNDREGSRRVRTLLGKSQETDEILLNAIVRRFIDVMTGEHSYFVALRAINVFNDARSSVLVNLTLHDAFYLASDKTGCIALNQVITGSKDFTRYEFLNAIAKNADLLSMDDSGTFVVQHALKFQDLQCTNDIALRLCGYYVELASQRRGSYIVEQILESRSVMGLDLVVSELVESGGATLLRLARNEFGNYVVQKALRVTWSERRADLYWGLVEKLLPFLDMLRRSHGRNIAEFIQSKLV
ncbi:unnamed protein product [Microthlaspi erraticum]|uniref:PUM-HD domain-containing protein n=1 Tax=Microthlaspi erraticum TaxID=1685480 RepID=A0A6D2JBX2_9BRAS|nr:unnamed protein product [Microthlaspi erraticum]